MTVHLKHHSLSISEKSVASYILSLTQPWNRVSEKLSKHFCKTYAVVTWSAKCTLNQCDLPCPVCMHLVNRSCFCYVQMLRVPTLAAGHELLLMTDESGAGMIGYVEREGIIKSLAMQEYKTFVDMLPPQMVCKHLHAQNRFTRQNWFHVSWCYVGACL